MQERYNSIANALELCLSCTNPSIYNNVYRIIYWRCLCQGYKAGYWSFIAAVVANALYSDACMLLDVIFKLIPGTPVIHMSWEFSLIWWPVTLHALRREHQFFWNKRWNIECSLINSPISNWNYLWCFVFLLSELKHHGIVLLTKFELCILASVH